MLLPVLKCCLLNQPSNCSLTEGTTLVLNACPLTCKIGLKRLVSPRISDPRPRHAFPETGCAIYIRTIESFINNTLVTDTMTEQTWKELETVRNSGFLNRYNGRCGILFLLVQGLYWSCEHSHSVVTMTMKILDHRLLLQCNTIKQK